MLSLIFIKKLNDKSYILSDSDFYRIFSSTQVEPADDSILISYLYKPNDIARLRSLKFDDDNYAST